ncbi:superfamily I DNA and RNA helicases and helicase subunits-like protein [Nostoc carneum NIES-2107]|nr:superfamily I DNA and RNA helicases and helicase subunits-like protein [Nostoc carneum NIES-2107]
MKATRKIDAILNAWFDYIALDDYSNARVEATNNQKIVKQPGVRLLGNHVLIDRDIFSELQKKTPRGQQNQQESLWVLSFPQVVNVENGKSYFCPLFCLDITSIFQGAYQEQGWNLDSLTLIEAGENLATFLKLDDEQCEQLITQDGLQRFLETTFGVEFQTYEQWMQQIVIPPYQIKKQPYLFEFTGAIYSRNLKQDLKEIKSSSKKWTEGDPAYEYLFGVPQLPKHEVTYMGAFPIHAPTNSQSTALKHAQTQPLTAVQGPPGSGKTTLILHVIAQQVVNRALDLIEKEKNINNLTVVTSTNNQAVDNVIEKLDKWLNNASLEHKFIYLKGGSKNNIQSPGGAVEYLQNAINYLQQNSFDESRYNSLKEKIKQIKYNFLAEESNYLEARQQRLLDEQQLAKLQNKIQTFRQDLDENLENRANFQRRASDLAEYEQLPIEAYRKINLRFENALRQLPEGRLSWWVRLWRWITRNTEKNIITKAVLACESAIENTFSTAFRVGNPTTRSELVIETRLVRERLDKADELESLQARLQEISTNILYTEEQINKASSNLTTLENRLANSLEDFYTTFPNNFHDTHQEIFLLSREFLTQQALQSKNEVKKTLELYSSFLSDSKNWKYKYTIAENLDEHLKNLSLIFPVVTSTLLSIRNMLPWISECIDRTIVDEAGMIDLHKTFPVLVRSRKAIIVGDPLQIEPIITLSNQTRENYRQTSFLDKGLTEIDYHRYSPEEEYSATTYHRAAGASGEDNDKGQGICLIEHYRCQPSIIKYCDTIAGYGLEVKTELVDSKLESNLIAYHVEGNSHNKVNYEEVIAVCDIIQHLLKQDYLLEDIGVISPFKVHANALKDAITRKHPNFNKKSVGTIHTFQGSEKKVIILSTKVCQTQDNVNWINQRPNLLNVAVSRAKELFILVGNLYRLEKGSLTRQLVEHIRENGLILEYKTEAEISQYSEPKLGTTTVYDCDHLRIFREAFEQSEKELIIITPWIRGSESRRFINDVVSVLERGVIVAVIYGKQDKEGGEDDNNDRAIENNLRELFSQYPDSCFTRLGQDVHSESDGTNEKILVCDTKFAVVGSWNWLSHPYRQSCRKLSINPKAPIRRETSIQIFEPSSIEDIKTRIYQLIR